MEFLGMWPWEAQVRLYRTVPLSLPPEGTPKSCSLSSQVLVIYSLHPSLREYRPHEPQGGWLYCW